MHGAVRIEMAASGVGVKGNEYNILKVFRDNPEPGVRASASNWFLVN